MSNNIINYDNVYIEIQNLMDNARNSVVKQVNTILIETYHEIGRIIVFTISNSPDTVWQIDLVTLL